MMRLAALAVALAALTTAVLVGAPTANTASSTVPAGRASNTADAVTADALKPAACAGISLTALVYGSGTISGAAGAVNELITASAGNDTITAGDGDDCVLAGGGVDLVSGEAGNDVLLGGPGDDHIAGNAGDDTLDGGTEFDRCYGGAGTNDVSNCERTYLDAPSALVASPGAALNDIDLSWSVSPALLATGYKVYRSTSSGGGYGLVDTVPGQASSGYTDTPPDSDTDYYYVVEAYFESLVSAYTNEVARVVRVATGDTYVEQDQPTENRGGSVTFAVKAESAKVRRAFVRFDLTSVPGTAVIDSATLRANIETAPLASRTYEAQRAASSWAELTVTWNTQPGVSGSAVTAETGTTADVWNEWTVSADVQDFVDGTESDYGWRIRDDGEGGSVDETQYHSEENVIDPALSPQLRVFYATP